MLFFPFVLSLADLTGGIIAQVEAFDFIEQSELKALVHVPSPPSIVRFKA
jgi:hypothetical protein